MAEITAGAVNEFRKRTGLGLMECKALLKEADGDLKKAEILAKERGLKNADKRAGRAAKAGRVEVILAPDHRSAGFVELNCETDFVARNEDFRTVAKALANLALTQSGDLKAVAFGDVGTVTDALVGLNARMGENVVLSRSAHLALSGAGRVDSYIHHDGKQGAVVAVASSTQEGADSDAMKQLVKDLTMHIVAAVPSPVCVRRDEVPAALVDEQKKIFLAQAADKPEQIREKIATGKLNSWYGEVTLLDQGFVKDPAKTIRDVVAEASKASGATFTVETFSRFVVGENTDSTATTEA